MGAKSTSSLTQNMMRVVHLLRKYNPDEWGGTETAIQRLFGGLRAHGVDSVVYSPELPVAAKTDPLRAAGCRIQNFRAFVPILGISRREKRQLISVGGNLLSFDLFPALRRERDVSVIHTHTMGRLGGIARTVARQRGVPLVLTIHGGVLDLPGSVKNQMNTPSIGLEWGRVFGLLFKSHRIFQDCDAVVTCNENEARLLAEQYPGKRIMIQPHGVPVEDYQQDRRDAALAAYPQLHNHRVLLCIGRMDSVKNQAWLVEHLPEIFRRHPEAILVLAGACTDEAYGQAMRNRIGKLGLTRRVLLTGGLPPGDPKLVGLLQLADVLLVPSLSETFGLVILEAWAAGTPVLSTRTSGACALVRNGQNGWLFDLEQPKSFHAALDLILNHETETGAALREGSDTVANEYDVKVLAGRMKRLYEELIEEKHALRHYSRRRYQRADAC